METPDNIETAELAEGSSETIETADLAEGRFTYGEIHQYLRDWLYPGEHSKTDKAALQKRAKFFTCGDSDLFYECASVRCNNLLLPVANSLKTQKSMYKVLTPTIKSFTFFWLGANWKCIPKGTTCIVYWLCVLKGVQHWFLWIFKMGPDYCMRLFHSLVQLQLQWRELSLQDKDWSLTNARL